MKKFAFFSFALVLSFNVWGQQKADTLKIKKNIIKTDVLGLLFTTTYHLNTSWEHLMSKKSSLQLDFFIRKNNYELGFSDFNMGLGASYRFYFNKNINQMKGFYMAPLGRLKWFHFDGYRYYNNIKYEYYDILKPYIGLQTGYQFMINKNLSLDLNTEFGYDIKSLNIRNIDKIYIGFGLKVGYKF